MSTDLPVDATGALPPELRQVARARIAEQMAKERKERRREKVDAGVVARSMRAPEIAGTGTMTLEEEVTRATQLARRNYLCLLSEKKVVEHFREILSTGDAKSIRELMLGLAGLLVPEAGMGAGAGATRITIHNRLPRPPASPSIDVTPRGKGDG